MSSKGKKRSSNQGERAMAGISYQPRQKNGGTVESITVSKGGLEYLENEGLVEGFKGTTVGSGTYHPEYKIANTNVRDAILSFFKNNKK